MDYITINKREQKFLVNAVVHDWKIHTYVFQETCHWDGAVVLPVRIGKVCEGLIDKGLLVRSGTQIMATKLGDSFKCICDAGRLKIYNDYDELISSEKHERCGGTGVLPDNSTK